MKTKVFIDIFKGSQVFGVWEVDEQGNKVGQYPLISMGGKKAVALSNHLEEFKDYANTSRVELERKAK